MRDKVLLLDVFFLFGFILAKCFSKIIGLCEVNVGKSRFLNFDRVFELRKVL